MTWKQSLDPKPKSVYTNLLSLFVFSSSLDPKTKSFSALYAVNTSRISKFPAISSVPPHPPLHLALRDFNLFIIYILVAEKVKTMVEHSKATYYYRSVYILFFLSIFVLLSFVLAACTAKMFFRHIGQEPPSSSICVNVHARVFVSQRENAFQNWRRASKDCTPTVAGKEPYKWNDINARRCANKEDREKLSPCRRKQDKYIDATIFLRLREPPMCYFDLSFANIATILRNLNDCKWIGT